MYCPSVTIPNTNWHSCNCWGPCHCWRRPQIWCTVCCSYTYSPHWHYQPLPWYDRDEALREEGRRQERERQQHKKHRQPPYVDISPALPWNCR